MQILLFFFSLPACPRAHIGLPVLKLIGSSFKSEVNTTKEAAFKRKLKEGNRPGFQRKKNKPTKQTNKQTDKQNRQAGRQTGRKHKRNWKKHRGRICLPVPMARLLLFWDRVSFPAKSAFASFRISELVSCHSTRDTVMRDRWRTVNTLHAHCRVVQIIVFSTTRDRTLRVRSISCAIKSSYCQVRSKGARRFPHAPKKQTDKDIEGRKCVCDSKKPKSHLLRRRFPADRSYRGHKVRIEPRFSSCAINCHCNCNGNVDVDVSLVRSLKYTTNVTESKDRLQ